MSSAQLLGYHAGQIRAVNPSAPTPPKLDDINVLRMVVGQALTAAWT